MAYGSNRLDTFRRAATYVDKILKGAKPADLPDRAADEFDFVVNLKTAQALGLTMPQSILQQATPRSSSSQPAASSDRRRANGAAGTARSAQRGPGDGRPEQARIGEEQVLRSRRPAAALAPGRGSGTAPYSTSGIVSIIEWSRGRFSAENVYSE